MATKPISNFSASWNESKTYSGIGLHVTDTAGTSQSKLLNLTINGQSKFSVDKVGSVVTTFISASHVTASGVKINTFNTNKIITNTISASYLSASVFITSNFSPSKVTATNISASYITASGLKISTFSTNKIVSTRISASYLSASSIRTGNFNPSKVTTTNISASYISASKLKVGNFPAGKKITFADGTTANIITPKLRAFTASISYLEMMTGSNSAIVFPAQANYGDSTTIDMYVLPAGLGNTAVDVFRIENNSLPAGINTGNVAINLISPDGNNVRPVAGIYSEAYNPNTGNTRGSIEIYGGDKVEIAAGGGPSQVIDPNIPRPPGTLNLNGRTVNIGQVGNSDFISVYGQGYADNVTIGGRNINLTPSGSSNCVKINGCLEISGNLVTHGEFRVGKNSLYLSSSNSSSRIYGTGLTVSASCVSASAINVHTASLTNVEIFSLVGTNISASYISASNVVIGKFPAGKRVLFSDQSEPSLLTNKLRAFSASISYLEMMTGSNPQIRVPANRSLAVTPINPSGPIGDWNFIIEGDDGMSIHINPILNGDKFYIGEITFPNTDLFNDINLQGKWGMGLTLGKYGSPKNPIYKGFQGFGLVNKDTGASINLSNLHIEGGIKKMFPNWPNNISPLSGGFDGGAKICATISFGDINYAQILSNFQNEFPVDFDEITAQIPSIAKPFLSGSNKITTDFCVNTCSIEVKTKIGVLGGGLIPIGGFTANYNTCDPDCITGHLQGSVVGTPEFEVNVDCSGALQIIKGYTRDITADEQPILYVVQPETYSSKIHSLKEMITSSADANSITYAAAAATYNLTLPLPSYQEVSDNIISSEPKYAMFDKTFNPDWKNYGTNQTSFLVNAVDIQSGSFIQGIGPNGNKLRISADKITANTLSASNFSVSGGLIKVGQNSIYLSSSNSSSRIYGTGLVVSASAINVHTASFTNVEIIGSTSLTGSLILYGNITASNKITASSAGTSTGKYAKIKIGNQIYKILLYADS